MTNGTVCEEGNFDIEAVIKEFLADSTRRSLELPRMTTGQRKQVKKAADQHADLKCESYGFGAERKLHLFKKSWDTTCQEKQLEQKLEQNEVSNAVNVKNTFIDDWVGGEAQSEPIIFRSMPNGMYRNLLQDEVREGFAAGPELSSIEESSRSHSPTTEATAAPESPRADEEAELRSTASSPTVLLPELGSVRVRNTFIHIEEETMDDRIVQSMPHGMFSQIIARESLGEATAKENGEESAAAQAAAPVLPSWHAPACLGDAAGGCQLGPGTLVVVEGLIKLPAFNGLNGVIQSLDEETGRYSVLLASPTLPNGQQLAKVKAQNLRPYMLLPPPPRHQAPSVLVETPSTDFINVPATPEGPTPLQLTALVACF